MIDLKLALRLLRKSPILTLLAIATLGSGIGLATAAFTMVSQTFYASLPVPHGRDVVMVRDYHRTGSYDVYVDLRTWEQRARQARSFDGLAAFAERTVVIQESKLVRAAVVTNNAFDVLGIAPRRLETGPVVLISHELWRAHFRSDPKIVGRAIRVDDEVRTIIGVMPKGFRFPVIQDLWIPADASSESGQNFRLFGRLRSGVTATEAEAEMRVIAAREETKDLTIFVVPFARAFLAPGSAWIPLALTSVLLLLLVVTAANVANLVLARTAARAHELAVRHALGARRVDIVRQLFIEGLVIGVLAAALGTLAARTALTWFRVRAELPFWSSLDLTAGVVAFIALTTAGVSAIVGVIPALRATRRRADERYFGRASALVIIAETAVSVGLLGAGAVIAGGLFETMSRPQPRHASEVLIAQAYFGQPEAEGFYEKCEAARRSLDARLRAIPAVRDVSFASHFPGNDYELSPVAIAIENDRRAGRTSRFVEIDATWFDVMQQRLIRGRAFHPEEIGRAEAPRVAIVSASFVKRHLGSADPIGTRIRQSEQPWLEIVGVAPDLGDVAGAPRELDRVYVPLPATNIVRVAIRKEGSPAALIPRLHQEAALLLPSARVQWSKTLREQLDEPVTIITSLGLGSLVIGGLALLLSCAGIYAVVAFTVSRRTREIAIRRALGSSHGNILRLVGGRIAIHVAAGAAIGLAIGALVLFVLDGLPIEVRRGNMIALPAVAAVMLAVSAAACIAPLRASLTIEPMQVLRHE